MESIGRLAGGIAHDFNNILTSIMGYAELLKMQFSDDNSSGNEAVDVILQGAERAADLTGQLLGFARKGKYNPVTLNINSLIKETIKVSEKIFEKEIKVLFNLGKNTKAIYADKNQLDQILTNLIINARDAMPEGGNLNFRTENFYVGEEAIKEYPELKQGYYVKVSVTDSGVGIPVEIKNKIFEPFYTTKGEGKGTGLGLATVYGIVKNHDGYIYCDSEPGKGTTFVMYFPVSEKEVTKIKEEPEIVRGDATILVVDDEENVRKLAGKMLKGLGYTVLVAEDGKKAVDLYKGSESTIDLVLLDMIMPDMAGKKTYQELKKINPEVQVLLMSGFHQDGKASEILSEGVLGFIQKPFKQQILSKIISETLKK